MIDNVSISQKFIASNIFAQFAIQFLFDNWFVKFLRIALRWYWTSRLQNVPKNGGHWYVTDSTTYVSGPTAVNRNSPVEYTEMKIPF